MIQLALGPLMQQGGAVFTPLSISGLTAWYDASDATTITAVGSAMTGWADKSGNGHHLTGTALTTTRTKNGLNVVDFNGSSDGMERSATIIPVPTHTFLAVYVQDVVPASPFISTIFAGGSISEVGLRQSGATPVPQYVVVNGGAAVASATTTTVGTWQQTAGMHRGSASTIEVWKNGSSSGAVSAGGVGSPTPTNLGIGVRQGGSRRLNGAVAEAILYNSALGSTDRAAVEAYLAAKWAV